MGQIITEKVCLAIISAVVTIMVAWFAIKRKNGNK